MDSFFIGALNVDSFFIGALDVDSFFHYLLTFIINSIFTKVLLIHCCSHWLGI